MRREGKIDEKARRETRGERKGKREGGGRKKRENSGGKFTWRRRELVFKAVKSGGAMVVVVVEATMGFMWLPRVLWWRAREVP